MAISEYDGLDAVSIGATEWSVTNNSSTIATNTDDGYVSLWVDASNLAKGDVYRIRFYEKVRSGSTQRKTEEWPLMGDHSGNFQTPSMGPVLHGWDFTIQKIAGTDRTFDASIRRTS